MTKFNLCGLLLLPFSVAGCGREAPAPTQGGAFAVSTVQVVVHEAAEGTVTESVQLVGNFLPRRRTIIVTEVDGRILSLAKARQKIEVEIDGKRYSEQMSVDLGEPVSERDVLIQIDPAEYELALASATARLTEAQKALADLKAWRRPEQVLRLEAMRDEARARLKLAESEVERMTKLRQKEAVSISDMEIQEAERDRASASLAAAQADLLLAKSGPTKSQVELGEARVALAQAEVNAKQLDLDRTSIRAPYDGVITDRYVDVGERVTALPRVEIMELMDLSFVVVQVGIPERLIHQVQVKDLVSVKAEGTVDAVKGMVVLLNDKVDPGSRTYRARVAVDNRARRFKAGQFVRVVFPLESSSANVAVPNSAVTYAGGQPQVFVLKDDTVALRGVRLGLTDGERIEIIDGLNPGETVVVDDPAVLADGMKVRVRQADAESMR